MTTFKSEFSGLRALFINCTLKRSPEISNTQGLIDISTRIMQKHGVEVDVVRAVDHDIATGVWTDMREHGWATDDWPAIFDKVLASDILVLAGPIWLGDNSSVMKQVHERLYGGSHLLNDAGQYLYYGRVGGCLVTGKRGRCQTLCAERALHPPTHRLHDSATGRRRLDRRSRAGTVVSGPGIRRAGKRLHQPQHHLYDVESAASGSDAEDKRRRSCVRKHPVGVGCRMSLRFCQSRVPVSGYREDDDRNSRRNSADRRAA